MNSSHRSSGICHMVGILFFFDFLTNLARETDLDLFRYKQLGYDVNFRISSKAFLHNEQNKPELGHNPQNVPAETKDPEPEVIHHTLYYAILEFVLPWSLLERAC